MDLFTNQVMDRVSTSIESLSNFTKSISQLPSSFDWRNLGKVTSVRDQSTCNACYAFAVTSAIESALALRFRLNLTSLPVNLTNTLIATTKELVEATIDVHHNSFLVTNIERHLSQAGSSGNIAIPDVRLSV